ncbi:MAG TPA: 2-succinyl-5-enolpyruvyl-6-hydroxy-3-cyclohexene-1-carboxylic-acid synthase [Acidimicrobiia bacterium]|nr:2-succinyl-5-enolpyruvyl-6-hydroxy-3-cyclohexene-1-carboxylic-acid synthase [Acidimicrobiia bacterium]
MSAPNPSVAMARVFIDEFVRNGIRDLVLAPGSRSGALAMTAAAEPRLQLHVALDERSAGFWAVGYGKVGQIPAVALTTSGTAVANLLPAVVEADRSQTPVVVVSADRPAEARHSGANQTIDQIKIFGERVRFFADVPAAADDADEPSGWRSLVCQAVAAARTGPVHLNLAFREPLVPATDDGRTVAAPYRGDLSGRSDGRVWTQILPASKSASQLPVGGRVLVVAGPGADRHLVDAAIAMGLVVVAEGHSGCRVPGTISTAHHLLGSEVLSGALMPDKAVVLGTPGLSRPLANLLAKVETIVAAPGWFDPGRKAAQMRGIGGWTPDRLDESWAASWQKAETNARQIIDQVLDSFPDIIEPRVARDVVAAMPDGGVLAVGSSMPVRDVDWFSSPRTGLGFVSNRGASGIDGFISLAAGAAGGAGKPVVGLMGDLSFLHDTNGLLIKPTPDLVLVLVNNNGGGIFSFLPQADYPEHFEQIFGTPTGVDFEGLSRALGAVHTLVERPDQLQKSIRVALTESGISIVEVRTDRARNLEVHRQITEEVTRAIESLFES